MKLKFFPILIAAFCCISCVTVDNTLGQSLIPTEQQYEIFRAEFPIDEIQLRLADSLSGYSSSRLTIGAIRDEDFGLTTRSCAFTLVPFFDTLDFGKSPEFSSFHVSIEKDTNSVASEKDANILQSFNVYELTKKLGRYDINTKVDHGDKRISTSTIIYNGKDSLSFDLCKEFGEKFLSITQEDLSSMDKYTDKFPGIYIESEAPLGMGGRINMFNLQLDVDLQYGYITGCYAKLAFNSEYNGTRKDTSFFFYFGADGFYKLDSLLTKRGEGSIQYLPQYGLNLTGHETSEKEGFAGKKILIEGGGGPKPVISASLIKEKLYQEILSKGGNPRKTLINKATIELPYEFDESSYTDLDRFPMMLNPTCRIETENSVTFASLTDSSSETEDPGTIDYSHNCYSPDITYHAQRILRTGDNEALGNYDVWLLIMAKEVQKSYTSNTSSSSDMSDYYNALMYANYYNNLYGGGYGYGGYGGYGYGGYGGYGYDSYYNNYMTYQMASMYANSSSGPSTFTTTALDTHRFYKGVLLGPEAEGDRRPVLKVIYSIPKE